MNRKKEEGKEKRQGQDENSIILFQKNRKLATQNALWHQ